MTASTCQHEARRAQRCKLHEAFWSLRDIVPDDDVTLHELRVLWEVWSSLSEYNARLANRRYDNATTPIEKLAVALDEGYSRSWVRALVPAAYRQLGLDLPAAASR